MLIFYMNRIAKGRNVNYFPNFKNWHSFVKADASLSGNKKTLCQIFKLGK